MATCPALHGPLQLTLSLRYAKIPRPQIGIQLNNIYDRMISDGTSAQNGSGLSGL